MSPPELDEEDEPLEDEELLDELDEEEEDDEEEPPDEVEVDPPDVDVDPPEEVEEMTIAPPPPPPPPKKPPPPPKKPPPPNPPEPPITTGTVLLATSKGCTTGASGTGAAGVDTVTTAGAHFVSVTTRRCTRGATRATRTGFAFCDFALVTPAGRGRSA